MKKKNSFEKKLPEIGQKVRALIREQRTTQAAVAKKAGWAPATLTELLKRKNWSIAELLLIGDILKHDLLQYYYPELPEGMLPAAMLKDIQKELTEALARIKEQDEEILVLKTENRVLREVRDKK